jgi:hypothetical protein
MVGQGADHTIRVLSSEYCSQLICIRIHSALSYCEQIRARRPMVFSRLEVRVAILLTWKSRLLKGMERGQWGQCGVRLVHVIKSYLVLVMTFLCWNLHSSHVNQIMAGLWLRMETQDATWETNSLRKERFFTLLKRRLPFVANTCIMLDKYRFSPR